LDPFDWIDLIGLDYELMIVINELSDLLLLSLSNGTFCTSPYPSD